MWEYQIHWLYPFISSLFIKTILSNCYLNFGDWQEKNGIKDMSVPGAGVIYHLTVIWNLIMER